MTTATAPSTLVGADPVRATPPAAEARDANRWGRGDWLCLGLMALIWLMAIIVVDPRGDFPLIDDWAFAWSVDQLVDHGRFALSDWAAPNMVGQILWGALFAKLFGTGFEALRLSSLVIGLIGGIAMYGWLRIAAVCRTHALIGTLCLILNPIYFALSFTFMTDIPYVAAQTTAMALLLASLAGGSRGLAVAGWALALFALSIRQVGVAIPIGQGVARLWRDGLHWRSLIPAIVPVLGFLAVQKAYGHWLAASGRMPAQFGANAEEITGRLAEPVAQILIQAGNGVIYLYLYGGLFILPVALLVARETVAPLSRWIRLALAGFVACLSVLTTVAISLIENPMPIWAGLLTPYGIGVQAGPPEAPMALRVLVTFAAAFGGSLGIVVILARLLQLLQGRFSRVQQNAVVASLIVAAVQFAPIPLMPNRFDRYLLPILPCLIIIVLVQPTLGGRDGRATATSPAFAPGLAIAVLAGFLGFGLAGTRDFMADDRARLAGLNQALALGHARDQIDAGWVLNGWHLYGRVGTLTAVQAIGSWHNDPVVRVGLSPSPGYEVIARIPVARSLPWAWGVDAPVLVERRMPGHGTFIGPSPERRRIGPELGVGPQ